MISTDGKKVKIFIYLITFILLHFYLLTLTVYRPVLKQLDKEFDSCC